MVRNSNGIPLHTDIDMNNAIPVYIPSTVIYGNRI